VRAVDRILKGLALAGDKGINGRAEVEMRAKAEELASLEKDTQQKMVSALVEAEMRKVELKLRRFGELEALLDAKRRDLEASWQRLYLDKLSLKAHATAVVNKLKEAAAASGEAAVALAEEAQEIASQNPQLSTVAGEPEAIYKTAKLAKPSLKPVSVDTPQTYKFWSA
jgi:hypothetical protein